MMYYSQDVEVNDSEQLEERRSRRVTPDRRISGERRYDWHGQKKSSKQSLKLWLRAITKPRSGVDRRKGKDRRKQDHLPLPQATGSLTQQEIAYLLKSLHF